MVCSVTGILPLFATALVGTGGSGKSKHPRWQSSDTIVGSSVQHRIKTMEAGLVYCCAAHKGFDQTPALG
jgi:hypothetical protein